MTRRRGEFLYIDRDKGQAGFNPFGCILYLAALVLAWLALGLLIALAVHVWQWAW